MWVYVIHTHDDAITHNKEDIILSTHLQSNPVALFNKYMIRPHKR